MALVIIIFIILLVGGWAYCTIKYHESSFVTYVYHWDYRVLLRLRQRYNLGIKKTPPDSFETFYNNSIYYIEEYIEEHHGFVETQRERVNKAKDLARMLSVQQYIHHYFTDYESFSRTVYNMMLTDFRSGEYNQRDYSYRAALRKILPSAIQSSDRAFNSFIKFVDAGWFDKTNGMYIPGNGRTRYKIGRAIRMICLTNNISSPEKVFAELWGEDSSRIKDWLRGDRQLGNQQIDSEVERILDS